MARYPTFEEYHQKNTHKEGIKRCDDLLKKNPSDPQLLITKFQLLTATSNPSASAVLDQLLALQPPLQDLRELITIEEALVNAQSTTYPPPQTAGPGIAQLWSQAAKTSTSTSYKLDLHSLRFSRAIIDTRLQDAQQALIQLKALQPRNRVFYMAHVAVTQMLSTEGEDLQARLALSLARKAASEGFDGDVGLDCRVPGQVFAVQGSQKDLEGVVGGRFGEGREVFDAMREGKGKEGGEEAEELKEVGDVPPGEWLLAEVGRLKGQFRELVEASAAPESMLTFAANAIRLFHTASQSLMEDRKRVKPDSCFLAISALIRVFEQTNSQHHLLQSAYLAETLLRQQPNIHEARMILVYLYTRLSLGSLALQTWHTLNIKEIQHDTVGHALFTNLSLTHPLPTKLPGKRQLDPLERLTHALTVYKRHEEKLAESAAGVLSHGQTGMLFDLQSLRHSLHASFTRRTIHLERLRAHRLLTTTPKDDLTSSSRPTASWLAYKDTRDFTTTFPTLYPAELTLHSPSTAPASRAHLLNNLIIAQAHALATPSLPSPVTDTEALIRAFEDTTPTIADLTLDDPEPSGRGADFLAADLARQVLRLLQNPSAETSAQTVKRVETAVGRLGVEALVKGEGSLAEGLRECGVYLDVLSLVVKTCERVKGKVGGVEGLGERCRGLRREIVEVARRRGKEVKEADVRSVLAGDGEVGVALGLFGEEGVGSFCASVVDAAKEGWEGVVKIGLGMK